jgi:hypothetical protein
MNLFLIGLFLLTGSNTPQTSLLEVPTDAKSLVILKSDDFKPVALMENSIIVEAELTGIDALHRAGINYQLLLSPSNFEPAKTNQHFYLVTPPFHKKSEAARDYLVKNGRILTEDNISYLYLTSRDIAEVLPKMRYEIYRISFKPIVLPDETDLPSPENPNSILTYNSVIDSIIAKITPTELAQLIRELSGEVPVTVFGRLDTIRTRYTTAPKNSDAIWYCYNLLSTFSGLDSVKFNPFTWEVTHTDSNVIATKLGTSPSRGYYIIGGHIDNTSETPNVYAPGADDNGTGTVAMIIAAKYLNSIPFRYTIRFIAWNAEEFGLYGSEAHALEARNRNDSILGVLDGDMIGTETINQDSLEIYTGTRTGSRALGATFDTANSTYNIGLRIRRSTQMPAFSDQYPYYQQGYNANCIIEIDFCPYYHTTQDRITANSFDTIFFAKVVKGMVATLATLAQPDTLYKDISMLEITQPIGNIDSGTVIVPQSRVKNNGYLAETFSVSFRIGDFYNETRSKTLNPGQIDTVNFPAWTAIQVGTHAIKCTTLLAGDMNSTNDYVTNSVTVLPVGIAENSNGQIPKSFVLENSNPNPFLAQTLIRYALPKKGKVNLQVYNVVGTLVRTLKTGIEKPGFYTVSWDGNDESDNKVAKGIYFYRLEAGANRAIKKMVKLD